MQQLNILPVDALKYDRFYALSTHFRNLAGFSAFPIASISRALQKYYIIHEEIFAPHCDWLKSDSSASRHLKMKILFLHAFLSCDISDKIKLITSLFLHLISRTAVSPLPPPPSLQIVIKRMKTPCLHS